jgi:hypothetical protein
MLILVLREVTAGFKRLKQDFIIYNDSVYSQIRHTSFGHLITIRKAQKCTTHFIRLIQVVHDIHCSKNEILQKTSKYKMQNTYFFIYL